MTFPDRRNGRSGSVRRDRAAARADAELGLVAIPTGCDAGRLGLGRSAVESVCAVLLAAQVAHLGRDGSCFRNFTSARPPAEHIRDDDPDQSPGDQQQRDPNDPAEIHPTHPTPICERGLCADCPECDYFSRDITSARSPVGETSTKRCYLVDVTAWTAAASMRTPVAEEAACSGRRQRAPHGSLRALVADLGRESGVVR